MRKCPFQPANVYAVQISVSYYISAFLPSSCVCVLNCIKDVLGGCCLLLRVSNAHPKLVKQNNRLQTASKYAVRQSRRTRNVLLARPSRRMLNSIGHRDEWTDAARKQTRVFSVPFLLSISCIECLCIFRLYAHV